MSLKMDPPRNGSLKNGSSNIGWLWNGLCIGLPADGVAPGRRPESASLSLGALTACELDCRGALGFGVGLGLAEDFCASTGSLGPCSFFLTWDLSFSWSIMERPSCSDSDGLVFTADEVPFVCEAVFVVAGAPSDGERFSSVVFVGDTTPPILDADSLVSESLPDAWTFSDTSALSAAGEFPDAGAASEGDIEIVLLSCEDKLTSRRASVLLADSFSSRPISVRAAPTEQSTYLHHPSLLTRIHLIRPLSKQSCCRY